MNPKLRDFLTNDYRSYNLVQGASILLGWVVIHTWPNLNVWPFWSALAAYAAATLASVFLYARHKASDTPVRVGFMLAAMPFLLLLASALRSDWWTWTGFSLVLPLAAIILASGFLYNAILAFVRTHVFHIDRRD